MAFRTPNSNDDEFVTVTRSNRSSSSSQGSNNGFRSSESNYRSNNGSSNNGSSYRSNNGGSNNGSNHGVKKTPRRENVEEQKNRSEKDKFNNASKKFEDLVKDESEMEVKMAFKKSVAEVTPEKIKVIIANVQKVCEKYDYQSLGIKCEDLPLKIQATVIGRIIKHVPLMGSGFCAYVETLKDLILEITHDQRLKKCTDYGFLNHLSWPDLPKEESKKQEILRKIKLDDYQRLFELMIELYGCDVRAKNVKGETALEAYDKAVKYGAAPVCEGVREILKGKISRENLLKMLCNMANAIDPTKAAMFGNTFKLGLLYDMPLLINILLGNLLKIRPESEKHGFFSQILDFFAMCRTMASTPIIDNEWGSMLKEKHAGSYDEKFKEFVDGVNIAARAKLQDVEDGKVTEEQLMYFTPTILPGIIIESSRTNRLDLSKVYYDFVSQRLTAIKDSETKRPLDQNMIIIATAHAVNALDKSKRSQLLSVMTPEILSQLNELITLKKISVYASTQIESIITDYLGEKLVSRDFNKICNLPGMKEKQEVAVHVRTGKNKKGNKKKETEQELLQEHVQVRTQEEKVTESVEDLSQYIDLDKYQPKAPMFLSTVVDAVMKEDGSWSDEKVDDWIYGLKHQKVPLTKAFIPTILYVVTNEVINQKTDSVTVTKKLELFKKVLEDIFGDYVPILQSFAKSLSADSMGCDALGFDSEFGTNTFKEFMRSHNITV